MAEYLPVSEFAVNEKVPQFTLKDSWKDVSSQYEMGLKLNPSYRHFHYYVNEGKEELPRLLVFQGSYYNSRPQFFVNQSSVCVGVHNYQNVCDLDYYYNAFLPDVVIFEVAEYTILENYFSEYYMQNTGWNPALIDARTTESYETDLHDLMDTAVPGEAKSLHFLQYDQLTKCYLYANDAFSAKYVYLVSGEQVFDLEKEENGTFAAMIPTYLDRQAMQLILVDFDGTVSRHECMPQSASFAPYRMIFSEHVESVTDISEYVDEAYLTPKAGYVYSSEDKDNAFNSIDLQLIDLMDGRFYESYYTTTSIGMNETRFQMRYPSGWYKLRLKANARMQDEYIDYVMYLEKGEWYYVAFELDHIDKEIVALSCLEVYGTGDFVPYDRMISVNFGFSDGVTCQDRRTFILKTNVEDNHFSSVILQAMHAETAELTPKILGVSEKGHYQGMYSHNLASGKYRVWLRGNSNKKDEYVEFFADLHEHALYEYAFDVVTCEEQCIVIQNFEFRLVAEEK